MIRKLPRGQRPPYSTLEPTVAHNKFHWERFWGRWIFGVAIPVPKMMFMGVTGRKLGLLPTYPVVVWNWRSWLRVDEFSDALVWVVVCDNLGDPLPPPL
jgi:hypothetical protein